jgi:cytidine deaminase
MNHNGVNKDDQRILEAARAVRRKAHAPYSGYTVGAAVLDENGQLHAGCNVENTAYPQGSCAEQNDIGAMVAAGGRRIVVIAAVGGHDGIEPCTPCGGCRQRISEFADDETRVLLTGPDGNAVSYSMETLLPESFRLPD